MRITILILCLFITPVFAQEAEVSKDGATIKFTEPAKETVRSSDDVKRELSNLQNHINILQSQIDEDSARIDAISPSVDKAEENKAKIVEANAAEAAAIAEVNP